MTPLYNTGVGQRWLSVGPSFSPHLSLRRARSNVMVVYLPMLQIRLLGQFEIQRDGQTLVLSSRQAQLLLAYLLLPPGRRHRRERLAGLLWPDVTEDKARARLRYALWQLRQVLGAQVVTADKVEIAFEGTDEFWLDTSVLEQELPPGSSSLSLIDSVAVYSGELLPDFYDDWLLLERSRLRAVFERKMEALLASLLADGDYAALVEQAEWWISSGQPPEKAFQALIAGHALRGDTAAAVQSYQRCRRMLEEELGVTPSTTTENLHRVITSAGAPEKIIAASGFESQPAVVQARAARGREPLLPADLKQPDLVGREEELAWLSGKWQAARKGAGSIALLVGEAGRGKSSLMAHFARQLTTAESPLLVSAGRGEAYFGQGDPHLLFRDVLALLAGDVEARSTSETISRTNARRLWRQAPTTAEIVLDHGPDLLGSFLPGQALYQRLQQIAPGEAALLDRLQAQLRQMSERMAPIHVAHGNVRRAIFDQYTRVLRGLSARQPLLILLDDLQWADQGSIDLLFHLGRRIQNEAILIIAALRQDDSSLDSAGESHPLQQLMAEFSRIFGDNRLNLDQRDRNKGLQLSNALLDREPNQYDDAFRQQLAELAGGHPLFTLELLRQMKERGELARDKGGRWFQSKEVDWSILPARVEAVIAGRILNLPSELREILSIASVEGQRFTVEVLAGVLQKPPEQLLDILSTQLHHGSQLVEPLETRRLGQQRLARYRFQHHLFQSYLYQRQEGAPLARRHESIARALEAIYKNDPALVAGRLAYHFEKAGLIDETRRYLLASGEQAKRQSADWKAIQALRHGLRLLEQEPASPARDNEELAFQAALGPPLVAVYSWSSTEAEAAFVRAQELAEALDQARWLPPVLWGLWSYYLVRGRQTRALSMARQIMERTADDDRQELYLTAHWTLGISSSVAGLWDQAAGHLSLAVESYDEYAQHNLIYRYGQSPGVTCLFWLALARLMLGEIEQAQDDCRRCLAMAEREEHTFSLAFGQACVAGFHAMNGDPPMAAKLGQSALRMAREGGYPFLRAMGLIINGWAAVVESEGEKPTREIQKGLTIMDGIGGRLFRPFFLGLAAEAELERGDVVATGELLDQAFAAGRDDGDYSVLAHLHQLRARQLAAAGADPGLILAELAESEQVAARQGARLLSTRAGILRKELCT